MKTPQKNRRTTRPTAPRPRPEGGARARGPASTPAGSQDAERLQKILARAGLASRREAEEWIRAGRVTVNGEVSTLGTRARGGDQVRLDGRLVRQAPTRIQATYVCHRSPGELLVRSARDSQEESEAMAERLPKRSGRRYVAVSPMPRIDGGLELLTADGELATRLQRAVRRLPVNFSLRIRGELSPEQIAGILEGELDSGERLQVLSCEPGGGEGANRWYEVETTGANGRELRSLVERQAATVSRVLRTSMGGLELERGLSRGHTRALTPQDIERLLGSGVATAAGEDEPEED
jgi:23S rRNA pseudouridine2605 synthase